MRYAIGIEYDGSEFLGWQIQRQEPTVQGCIERAVEREVPYERRDLPVTLYQFIGMMNPDIAQLEQMGVLKLNGDVYEMAAVYRKGLLTVNDAPFPIPLPGP